MRDFILINLGVRRRGILVFPPCLQERKRRLELREKTLFMVLLLAVTSFCIIIIIIINFGDLDVLFFIFSIFNF
jgi:hypothetical protein